MRVRVSLADVASELNVEARKLLLRASKDDVPSGTRAALRDASSLVYEAHLALLRAAELVVAEDEP
jgi:hypothetical protein